MKTKSQIKARLEYLRGELRAEQISYDELIELRSLAAHINPGDVELLEANELLQTDDIPEFNPKSKSDHQTYHDLQQAMRQMIRAGQLQSDAFQDAWRQCEALKNKNGGMPPMPDDEQACEMEACEMGNMEGRR